MDLLPLFPLPNVVLFPTASVSLHIFEPRYREMVGDALEGDRLIGMVLLRPGWERDYEDRPPIYATGCVGVITHASRYLDGRYDIVLQGVQRFHVLTEDHQRSYRRAIYEPIPERALDPDERTALYEMRGRLELQLVRSREQTEPDSGRPAGARALPTAGLSDEELVNALAQNLEFEPLEKLALLEQPCLRSRAQALLALLEMKMMVARTPGLSRADH